MTTRGVPRIFYAALLLAGCGDRLAGGDFAPPYTTLRGKVTNEAGVATAPTVRAALAWTKILAAESDPAVVAQEVALEAVFPAAFALDVDALPPPETMAPLADSEGGAASYAAAAVVAIYEDANGNGALDVPGDRIFGTSAERYLIVYLEGAAFRFEGVSAPLTPGFNLLELRFDPQISSEGFYAVIPLATEIVIALSENEDPDIGCTGWGCTAGGGCEVSGCAPDQYCLHEARDVPGGCEPMPAACDPGAPCECAEVGSPCPAPASFECDLDAGGTANVICT